LSRSIVAGMTDYSNQSFSDIGQDLTDWSKGLISYYQSINENIKKLKSSKYWSNIDYDFSSLIQHTVKFLDTSKHEIDEIVSDIKTEVRCDHITRLKALYTKSDELDSEFGKVWNSNNSWKEYGNEQFKVAERLYADGRDAMVYMRDLSNLVHRLKDFEGKKEVTKEVIKESDDVSRYWAFGCGMLFLVSMLVLAIFFPNPSGFQYIVFRIILSVSCAGFAVFIPGLLDVNMKGYIKASGALAVLVLVYFNNPAELLLNDTTNEGEKVPVHRIDIDPKGTTQAMLLVTQTHRNSAQFHTPRDLFNESKWIDLEKSYEKAMKLYEAEKFKESFKILNVIHQEYLDYYLRYSKS
jgi:hypothetical protein